MGKEAIVDSIVDTYEFSQKTKDKIKIISNRRIEELCLGEYSSIYRYISLLSDKFKIPYRERFSRRLDSPIKTDFKRNYHELIGDKRFCPENDFEKDNFGEMSLEEIIDVLDLFLDSPILNLVKQLGNENSETLKFKTSPDYLIKNIPKIQGMLESLFNEYGENLCLIKTRPIKQVQFFPNLKIDFGRRSYNGDPLAFFIKHRISYPGSLSKGQLKKIDGALSRALLRSNQINEAIPFQRKHTGIPIEKINLIVEAHKNCGIAEKVAQEYNVAIATVTKYWRENNLYIREKGFIGKKSPEEKERIVKNYEKCKNYGKIAKKFNISSKTVRRYVKKSNI